MKVLNFIPLLCWTLGFLAICFWNEHLRELDGRGEHSSAEAESAAKLYWLGVGGFTSLGILLSI